MNATCTVCGEPVIFAYAPGNPEPVDALHTINIGLHGHDAHVDPAIVDALDDGRGER